MGKSIEDKKTRRRRITWVAIFFLVLFFLGKGVVNLTDKSGNTLLHWASRYGLKNCARALLLLGAEANAKNLEGVRPLHLAIVFGHKDFDIGVQVKLFETLPVSFDYKDYKKNFYEPDPNQNGLIESLLSFGADPNLIEENKGETPIFYAAELSLTDVTDLLMKYGANLNPKFGSPPIISAILNGNQKMLNHLLEKGANPNEKCGEYSAISLAREIGQNDCVQVLAKYGAK